MLKLIIDLHAVQYLEPIEVMDDKVETQLMNNPNFLINKIHIPIYGLFDMETLVYMHSLIYFLL